MSISYIYISFINIKTCDKYDASSSVNEQIKNLYFNEGVGKENTKTTYIHDHFGERKCKNFIFTIILFVGGGGEEEKRGKIKF